jgi:hypothetical protein
MRNLDNSVFYLELGTIISGLVQGLYYIVF